MLILLFFLLFGSRVFQFNFQLPGRQCCHLQLIPTYWADGYGHIDTSNAKIRLLMIILSMVDFQFSPRVVQFKFSPPGGLWHHLQMISSCQDLRYGCLDTLNIEIRLLFQEIQAEQVDAWRNGGTDNLWYYKGYLYLT